VTLAIVGEHLIRYTREEVLPRLDRLLAGATAEASAPTAPARLAPAAWPLAAPAATPARAATAGS
jgi:hypothetical protein